MVEEVLTLAIHPSGNYLIASYAQYVCFYNIYPTRIEEYHKLDIQGSIEIKFTTHGNLVAIQKEGSVFVFKFFTAKLPNCYKFSYHTGNVKTMTWNEDDTGFLTTAKDNTIAVWQLPKMQSEQEDQEKIKPVWIYKKPLMQITSAVIIKTETAHK